MKVYSIAVIIGVIVLLSGCGKLPQPSREEWVNATTRTYNKSPDEILTVSEKLLRLADGDDFIIQQTENTLIANRSWIVYIVFGMSMGTDNWTINTINNGQGKTKVTVHVMTANVPNGTAIYDLYFSRLEYLLGISDVWYTCEDADEKLKEEFKKSKKWDTNEQLCNSFNIKDDLPQKLIEKIKISIDLLKNQNINPTVSNIAKEANVSENAVKDYLQSSSETKSKGNSI